MSVTLAFAAIILVLLTIWGIITIPFLLILTAFGVSEKVAVGVGSGVFFLVLLAAFGALAYESVFGDTEVGDSTETTEPTEPVETQPDGERSEEQSETVEDKDGAWIRYRNPLGWFDTLKYYLSIIGAIGVWTYVYVYIGSLGIPGAGVVLPATAGVVIVALFGSVQFAVGSLGLDMVDEKPPSFSDDRPDGNRYEPAMNIPSVVLSFIIFAVVLKLSVEAAELLTESEQTRNLAFGLMLYTVSLLLSYLFGAFTSSRRT